LLGDELILNKVVMVIIQYIYILYIYLIMHRLTHLVIIYIYVTYFVVSSRLVGLAD
jgi:hypothetical protein